ncbi:MAG: hypothetical protein AAB449_02225 [Patescibacteria group bacterium]
MLYLELLRVALAELAPLGYKQCDDRVLVSLDVARNKMFPASTRSPQVHAEVTLACQQASREILKTVEPLFEQGIQKIKEVNPEVTEEQVVYLALVQLGRNIPFEQLQNLLAQTIARVEAEVVPNKETVEA